MTVSPELSPLKGPAKQSGIFYGYVVVVCSFFIVAICFGINYSFGTFFNDLLQDFGWTRAVTSVGYSVSQLTAGAAGICTGWFTDRFGPKPTIIFCGISLALGCFLMSLVNETWQLNLFYGFFVGVGFGGAMIPIMATISRWFVKRRGLMTGIAVSGTGFGTIVMPLIATGLLSVTDWRTSFVIISVLAIAVVIPSALFLKRDPSKIGQSALGAEVVQTLKQSNSKNGLTFKEAIRTPHFWIIVTIYLAVGFFVQSIMLHIVPHAKALGIDDGSSALIVSCIGVGSICGRIIMGSVSDRIGVKNSLSIALIVALVAFIWLQMADKLWMLFIFGLVYGFAYGALIALQALVGAKMFGLVSLGSIVGVIVFSYTFGGTFGPIVTGYIFDVAGSYAGAFTIFMVLAAFGFVLTFFIKRPLKKEIN
jgi:MFS transporter, OFA family, oxalate/formate antiporter